MSRAVIATKPIIRRYSRKAIPRAFEGSRHDMAKFLAFPYGPGISSGDSKRGRKGRGK